MLAADFMKKLSTNTNLYSKKNVQHKQNIYKHNKQPLRA